MSRKLVYFNLNGRAECIRYLLHYGGLKFEDYRYELEDWTAAKDSLPYGQVPIYEEDGRTLNQSIAIARYVGSQVGLLPSDAWEQAKLDAAALNLNDFITKIFDYYWEFDPVKKEANKKLLDEAIPYYLSRFENELKTNNGHFGRELSWADFVLVKVVEVYNLYLATSVNKDYPTITALMSEIHALPGVKEYVATRISYVKPCVSSVLTHNKKCDK